MYWLCCVNWWVWARLRADSQWTLLITILYFKDYITQKSHALSFSWNCKFQNYASGCWWRQHALPHILCGHPAQYYTVFCLPSQAKRRLALDDSDHQYQLEPTRTPKGRGATAANGTRLKTPRSEHDFRTSAWCVSLINDENCVFFFFLHHLNNLNWVKCNHSAWIMDWKCFTRVDASVVDIS